MALSAKEAAAAVAVNLAATSADGATAEQLLALVTPGVFTTKYNLKALQTALKTLTDKKLIKATPVPVAGGRKLNHYKPLVSPSLRPPWPPTLVGGSRPPTAGRLPVASHQVGGRCGQPEAGPKAEA
jgi:hypothetical protein